MADFRHALKFAFISGYTVLIFQFISSLIIARLLTPQDFGLYSVAMVFAMLATIIRNFGVSNYIVKEKDLTQNKLENILAILVVISLFVGTLQFFTSDPIGTFYESEVLANILKLLALNLLLMPFGTITLAQLRRDMRMKEISIIEISSNLIGTFVTLGLAYAGYGVYSLALGLISTTVFAIIITHSYRYENHPKRLSFNNAWDILSFSSIVGLTSVVNHAGNSSQNWILGKALDMESVGLIARATSTVALFDRLITEPVNQLVAPLFANKNNSGEEFITTFVKLTCIQASVAWPSLFVLAYFSQPIIELLYGDQWSNVGALLTWICAAKMLMVTTQFANEFLYGLGRAKEMLWGNTFIQTVRVCAIFASLDHGLLYIVITASISTQVARFITYVFILKAILNMSLVYFLTQLSNVLLLCSITVIPVFIFDSIDIKFTIVFLPFMMLSLWVLTAKLMKLDIYYELQNFLAGRNQA